MSLVGKILHESMKPTPPQFGYHQTALENARAIIQHGFKTGLELGKGDGVYWISYDGKEIYEIALRPEAANRGLIKQIFNSRQKIVESKSRGTGKKDYMWSWYVNGRRKINEVGDLNHSVPYEQYKDRKGIQYKNMYAFEVNGRKYKAEILYDEMELFGEGWYQIGFSTVAKDDYNEIVNDYKSFYKVINTVIMIAKKHMAANPKGKYFIEPTGEKRMRVYQQYLTKIGMPFEVKRGCIILKK